MPSPSGRISARAVSRPRSRAEAGDLEGNRKGTGTGTAEGPALPLEATQCWGDWQGGRNRDIPWGYGMTNSRRRNKRIRHKGCQGRKNFSRSQAPESFAVSNRMRKKGKPFEAKMM
jgi:hypothetical protein